MTDDLFRRITLYHASMRVFIDLRKRGIINAEEFVETDTKMAQKYGFESSVIYRGIA